MIPKAVRERLKRQASQKFAKLVETKKTVQLVEEPLVENIEPISLAYGKEKVIEVAPEVPQDVAVPEVTDVTYLDLLTKKELMLKLKELGIEHEKYANRAELVELLKVALSAPVTEE